MKHGALIRNRRGSGIVETPIALMILSMLFVFFAGFCFAYYNKTVMNMAVHESARDYGVNRNIGGAIETAKDELWLGGVKDARVFYDSTQKRIVAIKDIGFYVPLTKHYLFHIASSAEFREESPLHYFRKGID